MSDPIVLTGGPAKSQNAYVGTPKELTVDTSNQELRLHDGTKAGGHKILNRDANDQRYQARSQELDGLTGFEDSYRGILVRLGPSSYKIRQLKVNIENMKVDHADGYDGDPVFSLAATISSDHQWDGNHKFTKEIDATGGLKGDTKGNHTGDVKGNVVGDVTGNLTGDASGNHTGSFKGSVDISEGSITFGSKQIPLTALGQDVIDYILLNAFPIEGIIPFHGDIVDIPDNYWPCDGTNGTPDLTDRFVICSGPVYAVDSFGGTSEHLHATTIDAGGEHIHTGTSGGTSITVAQMPKHKHLNGVVDKNDSLFNHGGMPANPTKGDSIDGNSSSGTREGWTTEAGDGLPHDHSITIDSGGTHTHSGSTANSSHIPPFYSKLFIMRID